MKKWTTVILWIFICGIAIPEVADEKTTFFLGRIKYRNNDGNDCTKVGENLMQLVSKASTIKVQKEKKLLLDDPELFETPFVFMNGHHDFVLSAKELDALEKYLTHGGFVFASGCCTNPEFPKAWRREFSHILPQEVVKPIEYDHPIYKAFYKIASVPCLNEKKEIKLEGLFYKGALVAVLCEDGLCCSFAEGNGCNSGKGIDPEIGKKLALNIAIYSITH